MKYMSSPGKRGVPALKLSNKKQAPLAALTVRKVKEQWVNELRNLPPENRRLIHLALNEAEALACQTGHPALFFPALALEKAEKAVAWIQRQSEVRASLETALTE